MLTLYGVKNEHRMCARWARGGLGRVGWSWTDIQRVEWLS